MIRRILFGALVICAGATAQTTVKPFFPANTFSIVAYDSATGQFGAAVQSHWFRVCDVIWVEAGVGAVATQSIADFSYGQLGIEMLKGGKTAQQAMAGLLAADSQNYYRQVAIIDKNGGVVTHTGSKCIPEAGHVTGKNYSVQANLMRNNTVWPAMAKAFEAAKGDLADRLMAALDAAQGEGGDIRGKQSAALVVVTGKPTGVAWKDKLIDIRVDDSPEPLVELHRLLNITRAYEHMNNGDNAIAVNDYETANREYGAAAKLAPGNPEILFWHAVSLVTANQTDQALPIFKQVFAIDKSWRELVTRLPKVDMLPDSAAVLEKILKQ